MKARNILLIIYKIIVIISVFSKLNMSLISLLSFYTKRLFKTLY